MFIDIFLLCHNKFSTLWGIFRIKETNLKLQTVHNKLISIAFCSVQIVTCIFLFNLRHLLWVEILLQEGKPKWALLMCCYLLGRLYTKIKKCYCAIRSRPTIIVITSQNVSVILVGTTVVYVHVYYRIQQ